jgi:hypothetical protein
VVETLVSFGCLGALFCVVVVSGVLVLALTVRRAVRVGEQRQVQHDLLGDLGLSSVGGSPWRQGEIDGLVVAAKASRGASIGMMGVQIDGQRMFVTVIAMAPVAIPPIGGRMDIAAGHRDDTRFETLFVPVGGARHDRVPEQARQALVSWVHETDDDVVLVDRQHRMSHAGPALPDAEVVVRVQHTGPLETEALLAWLHEVVARARSVAA